MSDTPRYKCPYCETDFGDKSNRRRHVKKQHPDKAPARPVDTPEEEVTREDLASDAAFDAIATDGEVTAPGVTAGDIAEGEMILWLGVPAEIVKRRTLTEGMVRMWLSESRWFDIPARTPVRRVKSGAERG